MRRNEAAANNSEVHSYIYLLPQKMTAHHTIRLVFLCACVWAGLFRAYLRSQNNTLFQSMWNRVEVFRNEGRPQSASVIVDSIYLLAMEERNEPQRIKAIVHRMMFRQLHEEDAFQTSLSEMDLEISRSGLAGAAILRSALAEMYWWYYQGNIWIIRDRLPTNRSDPDDLSFWTGRDFSKKIARLYQASLTDKEFLQKIHVSEFEPIWEQSADGRALQPTLYDVLVHRALEHFMNNRVEMGRPVDPFYIVDSSFFMPAPFFADQLIQHSDSFSNELLAMQLWQEWLKFHIGRSDKEPLVFHDVSRLGYVKNHYDEDGADHFYENALRRLIKTFPMVKEVAGAYFELAQHKVNNGQRFASGDSTMKWLLKEALDLCVQCEEKYKDSRGAALCYNLRLDLQRPALSLTLENVISPNTDFLVSVGFRNADSVYFRIVEDDRFSRISQRGQNHAYDFHYYLPKEIIQSYQYRLKNDGDLQLHRTELGLDALPPGRYVLLASLKRDFIAEENLLVKEHFTISDLAFIVGNAENGDASIVVTNRKNGAPIEGVKGRFYEDTYDNRSRSRLLKEGPVYLTNEQGIMTVSPGDRHANYIILLCHRQDSLIMTHPVFLRKKEFQQNRSIQHSSIFTDRSIYRPGQRVYFKGLLTETTGPESKIIQGKHISVRMLDVNNQEVGKQEFVSGEDGSYHGFFTIPMTGLTGYYVLEDGISRSSFSVEEYKRPSFFIEMSPVSGNFKVNEWVTVRGKAISMNGVALDGASGSFNVLRKVNYPYHWLHVLPVGHSETEIAHGSFTTAQDGSFEVRFKAKPDPEITPSNDPVFLFQIHIGVTDINGETREQNQIVQIGYRSLDIGLLLNEEMELGSSDSIGVVSRNLNGLFTTAEIELEVFRLREPDQVYRERLWPGPDILSVPEDEFRKRFPHDAYREKAAMEVWPVHNKIYGLAFTTSEFKKLHIPGMTAWEQGAYLFVLRAKDPFGQKVEWQKRVVAYNRGMKSVPVVSALRVAVLEEEAHVGQHYKIDLGTSYKDGRVFFEYENKKGVFDRGWLRLQNERTIIDIPVTEDHRGNFSVFFALIHDGRISVIRKEIHVPYDNKKLDVSLKTFRSELEPGADETWEIQVKAPGAKTAAGHVLAAMYDMSLDQFKPHQWSFNPHTAYLVSSRWLYGDGFNAGYGQDFAFFRQDFLPVHYPRFDRFNWFGLTYHGAVRAFGNVRMTESLMNRDGAATVEAKSADVQSVEVPAALSPETPPKEGPEVIRTNLRMDFRETAFFYPALTLDEQGRTTIRFKVPDAITRWKFQAFAHNSSLEYGFLMKECVSVKKLMVTQNLPRFISTGDSVELAIRISNTSSDSLSGTAGLTIRDMVNDDDCTHDLLQEPQSKGFSLAPGRSIALKWKISAPLIPGVLAVTHMARTAKYTDGEERILPVISTREFVTETQTFSVKPGEKRSIAFSGLEQVLSSNTATPLKYVLESTSNPAWYVVQSLPYLANGGNESNEQLFNRYYAHALAQFVIDRYPEIEAVFQQWTDTASTALLSNLETNSDLKNTVLHETPWLIDAAGETASKQRVAAFFDKNNIRQQQEQALKDLVERQDYNGAWSWFPGMPDDRFITQLIMTGLGRLHRNHVIDLKGSNELLQMQRKAIRYIDERAREEYEHILTVIKNRDEVRLSAYHIQYLYVRSLFPEETVAEINALAYGFFKQLAQKQWLDQHKHLQAMIALALFRAGEKDIPVKIIQSLRETAVEHEEKGMYWKQEGGCYWYQSEIESQAMLMEAFDEIVKDEKAVDEMKTWMLKQKQTHMWTTSKATADACYAVLMRGKNPLTPGKLEIRMGGRVLETPALDRAQAGTGYSRLDWPAKEITREFGLLDIKNEGPVVAWGAAYVQYLETADKVQASGKELSVKKEYYITTVNDEGVSLKMLEPNMHLKTGDLLRVRLHIRADRDFEYVHLKDHRAAGFEPSDVLSGYRYGGGTSYYLSVRDAANHYYFDRLARGTHLIEYEVRLNHAGVFSSGTARIQSQYAPEFNGVGRGRRIQID